MTQQSELQRSRLVAIADTATAVTPTQPTANNNGGTEPSIVMSPHYPAGGTTRGFMLFIESGSATPGANGYGLVIWKRDSATRRWANLLAATLPADTWLTVCDCPPSEIYFQIAASQDGSVIVHFEEI